MLPLHLQRALKKVLLPSTASWQPAQPGGEPDMWRPERSRCWNLTRQPPQLCFERRDLCSASRKWPWEEHYNHRLRKLVGWGENEQCETIWQQLQCCSGPFFRFHIDTEENQDARILNRKRSNQELLSFSLTETQFWFKVLKCGIAISGIFLHEKPFSCHATAS